MPTQAVAAWRWYNYVSSQVPPEKEVLRLNLDETSVRLFHGDRKGNVFVSPKRPREEPIQRVSCWKRRCCMTHVGLICDQTHIQPRLPQIIIGNEATLPAKSMASLRAACPPNVILLRRRSAWSNSELCAWIVQQLAHALAPYLVRFQPVLLMDASRIHVASVVLRACHRAGIWVVLVPARLTWLMQPLDTHGFQRYKAHLRSQYQDARCRSAGDGDLAIGEFLPCVYSAVKTVLQGTRWAGAFSHDGFGDGQAEVSSFIKRQIGTTGLVQAPASRPSDEQLALCFPKRTRVPARLLWRPFDVAPTPLALPSTASGSRDVARVRSALPAPREPRTRAEHRAAAIASATATTPASRGSALGAVHAAAATGAPRVLGRTRAETRRLAALANGGGAA